MVHRIRAHFDGRVLVPEQPVDLPVNQVLDVQVSTAPEPGGANGRTADQGIIEERLRKLRSAAGLLEGPVVSLDALRRENMYDERA